jgi:hypothetical protein
MAQLNNQEGWQSCTSNHKNCSPVNFKSHLIKVRATIIGLRHFATWRRSPWEGWALVSLSPMTSVLHSLSLRRCFFSKPEPGAFNYSAIIGITTNQDILSYLLSVTRFVLFVNGVEDTLGVKLWGTSMTYSPYRSETQKELGQGHSQVQACIVGMSPTHRPLNLGENS